ncbi:hypothetical protein SS1G_12898 [Sclerotinia sclerotiorum 1980 UF-70]|uniref:Uncharacterized protein n=2 Tax=Sclerotinia sclerotiorum (strain ATCC 18683 / 1980 / Ss-1) TaxID=665079 RepID=A7F5M0_SCLS1|nr:hypothetical protein SS1G_12898 [Sclerotinia sclerotiorum 1980 UF-70]APA06433.1 hypothetical protein sscle_02g012030 [Sclerotinia sclerotiorum 1980 UF-70]EDN98041.1 hypothetical protein SS1G_12898 [Sclerotinia sclerotiorum 1980 UF-70]
MAHLWAHGTHFIFDFDGTITTEDTTKLIADVGIAHQRVLGYDLSETWEDLVKSYAADHAPCVAQYLLRMPKLLPLPGAIGVNRALKEVQLRSIDRINKTGLFAGISKEEWESAGRVAVLSGAVKIRRGFGGLVQQIERRNGVWGVVSASFSKDFIKGVLEQCLRKYIDIPILANYPDENGLIRGPLLGDTGVSTILTSGDTKLSAMKQLLESWRLDADSKAVYYGDDDTDIECIFDTSVKGVMVGEDASTKLNLLCSRYTDTQSVGAIRDFENIVIHPE